MAKMSEPSDDEVGAEGVTAPRGRDTDLVDPVVAEGDEARDVAAHVEGHAGEVGPEALLRLEAGDPLLPRGVGEAGARRERPGAAYRRFEDAM